VSVVVPCIDEETVLAGSLQRLRRLMPDVEIVVADGGSRDRSIELARRLARVVSAPPGRGVQMNAGAAAASGEVLLFLHADARLRADPRPLLAALLRDPGCAAVYFTQHIRARGLLFRWIERAARLRAWGLRWILGDLGLAVRRDLFDLVGGFPPDPLFEDLGISRRLRRHGRFRRCSTHLYVSARRWQHRGVLRTTLRNWGLTLGYYLGVPTQRLAQHYRAVR
jgi:rSAM/selenodomain-associated transferase 2